MATQYMVRILVIYTILIRNFVGGSEVHLAR